MNNVDFIQKYDWLHVDIDKNNYSYEDRLNNNFNKEYINIPYTPLEGAVQCENRKILAWIMVNFFSDELNNV